ncbi:hypothetical protein NQ318_023094 [Aromia moschata]|uniref:Uncharacterized protein n=1 Tax=Aromia moschata TaxID=1265417 RepID=A0AAV8X3H5_9CUCU|nr:hypothetical protein NQ318_023094 [Aromia moschata]
MALSVKRKTADHAKLTVSAQTKRSGLVEALMWAKRIGLLPPAFFSVHLVDFRNCCQNLFFFCVMFFKVGKIQKVENFTIHYHVLEVMTKFPPVLVP